MRKVEVEAKEAQGNTGTTGKGPETAYVQSKYNIMNSGRGKVVLVGIMVTVLMDLFPPRTHNVNVKELKIERAGNYGFLFSPSSPDADLFRGNWKDLIGVHLDVPRLLVQWLLVVIIVYRVLVFMNQEGSRECSWKDVRKRFKRWFFH